MARRMASPAPPARRVTEDTATSSTRETTPRAAARIGALKRRHCGALAGDDAAAPPVEGAAGAVRIGGSRQRRQPIEHPERERVEAGIGSAAEHGVDATVANHREPLAIASIPARGPPTSVRLGPMALCSIDSSAAPMLGSTPKPAEGVNGTQPRRESRHVDAGVGRRAVRQCLEIVCVLVDKPQGRQSPQTGGVAPAVPRSLPLPLPGVPPSPSSSNVRLRRWSFLP